MRTILRSMSMVAALALVLWFGFDLLARMDETPAEPPNAPAQEPVIAPEEVRIDLHGQGDEWYVLIDGRRISDTDELAAYLAERHSGRPRVIIAHPDCDAAAVAPVVQASMREPETPLRMQRLDAE